MIGASFRSAGYALKIEDNPAQKIQSKRKAYAPVAFGSKMFSAVQIKITIYSKKILAIYMAFLEFAHNLWEAPKPTIVLMDFNSVTHFCQTKAIPPSLGNACDYMLQLNFKTAHNADSVNTAAEFLSRLDWKSRKRSFSKSGKMYKQCPLRSQHPPQMLHLNSNSSSRRQMTIMSLRNKPLKGKSNLGKRQQSG